MKKRMILLLTMLGCVALLWSGCGKGTEEFTSPVYYTVTFQTAGGSEIPSVKVASGGTVREPEIPERDGYVFNGWVKDGALWSFANDTVDGNMTLSARWTDAKSVFEYEIADGEVIIKNYTGDMENPFVPSVMDTLPVTTIAPNAFAGKTSETIRTITLGTNVKKIGESAFKNCTGVEIRIRGALISVGEYAFFGCDGLSELPLGEGLTTIPFCAFGACTSLVDLVLPNSLVSIGENAFDGCMALETVMLSGGIQTIEDSAFLDCAILGTVYHRGTPAQWEATDIRTGNDGNETLIDANVFYYAAQQPEDTAVEYWYYNEKGDIRVW